MRHTTAILSLLLAALPRVVPAALTPGDHERSLEHEGRTRLYDVHVPPGYDGSAAVPLVVDIHGFLSNRKQQAGLSGMNRVADERGFLVAHPEGIQNSWKGGNVCCGVALRDDVDDVGFLRAVVAAIAAEGNVDLRRVYASGLSNGGAMSHTLACEAADLFAAAAPMAFPVPYSPLTGCRPSRPIPVMTVMGLTDELVAYDGGFFASAPDSFAYWRDVNGCAGTEPDETVVTGMSRCETYTHCSRGVETALCSVTAMAFPGTFLSGHILYFNDDLDLAQVAWDFMSRFTLEASVPVTTGGQLTGSDKLRIRRLVRASGTLAWQLTVGAWTWWAEDGQGNALTGSYRGNASGRRLNLTLSEVSRETLAAAIEAQAREAGVGDVAVAMASSDRVLAVINRTRTRAKLVARFRITGAVDGETRNGTYTFRASGPFAEVE
jgi:polyhydroxybutyrate depolymerase